MLAPRLPSLISGLSLVLAFTASAAEVHQLDPHLRVSVTESPPKIRLAWEAMPDTEGIRVFRREDPSGSFVSVTELPKTALVFEDTQVSAGRPYEYRVERVPPSGAPGRAYVMAGIRVPFRDDQGVVLIVVDASLASAVGSQLARLESDLRDDGWDVLREEVSPSAPVTAVKEKILAAAAGSAGRLRAVFLLGGVPRPFSGSINPDGHPDHRGAWPADGYYADLDGTWSDNQNLVGVGVFTNVAGDGKFDPSMFPGELELGVGRVDTLELPAFAPLESAALVTRYLDRNHDFRTGALSIAHRAWVTDNFGYMNGEAFSRLAWRDSHALFGAGPESSTDGGVSFFDALESGDGYALALGCGPGNPSGAEGVGSTADFATRSPKAIFAVLFGSYFGDWSYPDNFLRAALVSRGAVLGATWGARPYAHLHGLGALQSFGDVFLAGANVRGYDTGAHPWSVHQALLGDPTLRMFVTRGPTGLTAAPQGASLVLEWTASPEPKVVGYHVYRRQKGVQGAAARLTPEPIAATRFVDEVTEPEVSYEYRVVAVALLTTGSGSYYNHSPGVRIEAVGPKVDAGDPDAGTVETDGGAGGGAGSGGPGPGGCGCGQTPLAPPMLALGAVAALRALPRRGRSPRARSAGR